MTLMKIKEILIESFRSPFVNLLAISNLAMLAIIEAFEIGRLHDSVQIFRDLNAPALVVSFVVTRSMASFVLIPPLVYLQWIFIGAFAKLIASHLKPKTD